MLVAASSRTFAGSTLRTAVFLERSFRAHVIRRERLVFDTTFAPPARGRRLPHAHLYAQLDGELVVGTRSIRTPALLVLAAHEFDQVEPAATKFRSGPTALIVEIRVPASAPRVPVGIDAGPVATVPWEAYDALARAHAVAVAPEQLALRVRGVIDALARVGILREALPVVEEPPRYQRLWETLRPLYEDYATSTSLKQLSVLTKLSLRQLARDLGDLTRELQLFGGGFRETMRVLRLRAAVLFLSAPEATPGEVARAVGYGSLDAMARAFRDAGLPAPAGVRAALSI